MQPRFLPAVLSAALLMAAGCAGYRLGPTNGATAGAQSIQVNYFQNLTEEPRLVEAVNNALRKRLLQDGTYRLATHDDGDIVVTGRITEFQRSGVSFRPGDIQTVRDYNLRMAAEVTATERATGKVVMNAAIVGDTVVRAGNDLPTAERQAVPLLAQELARKAGDRLTEGGW